MPKENARGKGSAEDRQSRLYKLATCVGKIDTRSFDDAKTRETIGEGDLHTLKALSRELGITITPSGEIKREMV